MKLTSLPVLGLAAVALATSALVSTAQIERLSLGQMVAKTDDSIVGEIVAKKVFRVDHPVDGNDLFFTTITVRGRSLVEGQVVQAEVTYLGGFVSPEEGVYNSEAPTDDETRLGNEVVVFYFWNDNLGGGVAGNMLQASHGGIYRVVKTSQGHVTLGKGDGYAIDKNWKLVELDQEITRLHDQLKK